MFPPPRINAGYRNKQATIGPGPSWLQGRELVTAKRRNRGLRAKAFLTKVRS